MSHRDDGASVAPWWKGVVLLGACYALVGIAFALPSRQVTFWRPAAWIVSVVAFTAHLAHERLRLRNSSGRAARHVAAAAALGAFGLAVGANLHSLSVGSTTQQRRLLLLALAVWPIITAIPAFLVALGLGGILRRVFAGRDAG